MLGCLLQVKLGHRCLQYQRYTGHLHRWWRISQLCLVTMAFLGHRRLGLEGCFPKEPFIRLLFCCFECQECLSKPWAGEGGRKDEECLSCLFQEQAACRKEADALLPCSLLSATVSKQVSAQTVLRGNICFLCLTVSLGTCGSRTTWTLWIQSGFDLMGSPHLH